MHKAPERVGDKKIVITGIRYGEMIGNAYVSPGKTAGWPAPHSGQDFRSGAFCLGTAREHYARRPFDTAVERAAAFTFRVIIETQRL